MRVIAYIAAGVLAGLIAQACGRDYEGGNVGAGSTTGGQSGAAGQSLGGETNVGATAGVATTAGEAASVGGASTLGGACNDLGEMACGGVPESCGDHMTEPPEQCDDGNKDDTDDCTSACKKPRCGDGAIWKGHEACDDKNAVTEACPYGEKACTVCNSTCQNASGNVTFCGDSVLQADLEQCDFESSDAQDQCARSCELSTWALWPLTYVAPPLSTYDYTDDTVIDKTSGLEWQRASDATDYVWADAFPRCDSMMLGGHSDWRLPTTIELLSLVDYSIASPGPTINTTMFPGALAAQYWSSSPIAGTNLVFAVNFVYGGTNELQKTVKLKVRCVR